MRDKIIGALIVSWLTIHAAVIVWDAKTKTEHFIRTASFSGAEDFGFLVPTPTPPELAEAANARQTVSKLIRPKFIHMPHFDGFDFTPQRLGGAVVALQPQAKTAFFICLIAALVTEIVSLLVTRIGGHFTDFLHRNDTLVTTARAPDVTSCWRVIIKKIISCKIKIIAPSRLATFPF